MRRRASAPIVISDDEDDEEEEREVEALAFAFDRDELLFGSDKDSVSTEVRSAK